MGEVEMFIILRNTIIIFVSNKTTFVRNGTKHNVLWQNKGAIVDLNQRKIMH